MTEDWFDVMFIGSSKAILWGTRSSGAEMDRMLNPEEVARVEQLQSAQSAAMQKLLRELAA